MRLGAASDRARGVAFVGEEVTDTELQAMDRAGVRGVRFNFVKRLVDFTPRDVLERIAARVAKLGWHIVVYFEMPDLPELEPFFTALPTTVVVDHMGTPDVSKGVDHPENQRFHRLMEQHPNFWVKVTCPERLTVAGPPYDDVVPFAEELVASFPDRVLWGTDWPHPNMKKVAPDDGVLTDRIPMHRAHRRSAAALPGRQSDAAVLVLGNVRKTGFCGPSLVRAYNSDSIGANLDSTRSRSDDTPHSAL